MYGNALIAHNLICLQALSQASYLEVRLQILQNGRTLCPDFVKPSLYDPALFPWHPLALDLAISETPRDVVCLKVHESARDTDRSLVSRSLFDGASEVWTLGRVRVRHNVVDGRSVRRGYSPLSDIRSTRLSSKALDQLTFDDQVAFLTLYGTSVIREALGGKVGHQGSLDAVQALELQKPFGADVHTGPFVDCLMRVD